MKYKQYRQPTRCNNNGLLIIPASSTRFRQLFCPKRIELTGIVNKPLLLHLFGCLYYLHQRCTVKQISDNEIYLLIKYVKSVLWRAAKRLSYIGDARCLKVNKETSNGNQPNDKHTITLNRIFESMLRGEGCMT